MIKLKAFALLSFYTLSILLSIGFSVNGQVGKYTVNWFPNSDYLIKTNGKIEKKKCLNLEGTLINRNTSVPSYSRSIKLSLKLKNKIFHLVNLEYEVLSDSMREQLYLPNDLPTDSPQLNIYKAGSDQYLVFNIIPIRMDTVNNKYELLKSFEISSSEENNLEVSNAIKRTVTKSSTSSVLASGYWYKIKVLKSGIYKLTYSDLTAMGFSDPSKIRVFGNGGIQLSYLNSSPRPEDLKECPIYMNKGSDGVFNDGDYILFYAEGPVTWQYNSSYNIFMQDIHKYSEASYYFLTADLGEGEKIPSVDNTKLVNNVSVNSFDDYGYYEKNLINLIRSGREWYSIEFSSQPFDTTFHFPNIITTEKANVLMSMAGRSEDTHYVTLKVNDSITVTKQIGTVDYSYSYNVYGVNVGISEDFYPASNNIRSK